MTEKERKQLQKEMYGFAVRVLRGTDRPQETAILPEVLRCLLSEKDAASCN